MAENTKFNKSLNLFHLSSNVLKHSWYCRQNPFLPVLQLTVKVLDVNDVTPMFQPQFYLKSVMEDIGELEPAEDRKILTIFAKDDDEGDNAKIIYTITKGNDEGLFSDVMKISGNVCSPSIKGH